MNLMNHPNISELVRKNGVAHAHFLHFRYRLYDGAALRLRFFEACLYIRHQNVDPHGFLGILLRREQKIFRVFIR